MKHRLILALFLSFALFGCESVQQAYLLSTGDASNLSRRVYYRDDASNVGVALTATYRFIGKPLRGERIRLIAVQSLVEIDIENKGTKPIIFDPRKLKFLSSNYLFVELSEFIEKNKINATLKQGRVEIQPGKGERCYASFVADFGDSSSVVPIDYVPVARLPKTETAVLLMEDGLKYGDQRLSVPPIRFKPQE
ncbi:MAG: hypothetical protein RMI34_03645 [Chloroherpetonaceae bacterium]|nr:hypothetical protein [Chloroherpetonaceae bacterium]MCS7210234.1 hypothetical protein [Chloroherpetonaceae bacterium]MDW8019154.1 hypothetical protein [Chloroherpetonaceae bacterium]